MVAARVQGRSQEWETVGILLLLSIPFPPASPPHLHQSQSRHPISHLLGPHSRTSPPLPEVKATSKGNAPADRILSHSATRSCAA